MPVNAGLLDTSIPMSAKPQIPDIPMAMGRGMDLKQKQIETENVVRENQEANRDREVLQAYQGDLYTPEGVDQAMKDLKGKVSFGTYDRLQQQAQKVKAHDMDARAKINSMNEDELKLHIGRNNLVLGQLIPALDAYAKDKQAGGEQAAQANFEKNRANVIQSLAAAKDSMGRPLLPPEMLQTMQGMGPEQLAAAVKTTKVYHDIAETKWKESQIQANEALVKQREAKAEELKNAPPKYKNALLELEAAHANGDVTDENYSLYKEALLAHARGSSGGGGGNIVPKEHSELHGDDYLKTLPTGVASSVKAIAEGRAPLSSISVRGGAREAMIERVSQYDPTFNASQYNTKAAVQKDFTSGPTSKNITSINTSIGHAGTLAELADALGNDDTKQLNRLFNFIATETGRPEVNNFDMAKLALGDELMKTFRGAGASETEAEAWRQRFNSASSPKTLRDAAKTAMTLLSSRIDAVDDQWKRGMNTDDGYPRLVSGHALEALKKIDPEMAKKYETKTSSTKVAPSDQKSRDSEAVKIMRDELAQAQSELGKWTGDAAGKARLQERVDGAKRELKRLGVDADSAAPKPAAKLSDEDLINKYRKK